MDFIQKNIRGFLLCLLIALPCQYLGTKLPLIGGPVFGILAGMVITRFLPFKETFKAGITFTSKKILQYAVILLGFGLNLHVVVNTGIQSMPIIISTIGISLLIGYLAYKFCNIPDKTAALIGVGSSICGGSAVAATAPVVKASDEEVASSISVIFLFNVVAALTFPMLGNALGFDTTSGEAFGIFAGTAVNDTSAVTATASTWDAMHNLGTATLDKAVMVKLTRTLAIIPITLVLSLLYAKKNNGGQSNFNFKNAFPTFILYFVLASVFTTICMSFGSTAETFAPMKNLSKFFIIMAMTAIGLNTDVVKLVKSGTKPIILGFSCWMGITITALIVQYVMGIW